MLKKKITYTDFDGNERTEEFTFNLSKAELLEMELSSNGGMQSMLNRIVNTQSSKELVAVFKDIILRSYGEKSDDGKHFIKKRNGRNLAEDFEQTDAYAQLFFELATNADAASAFINGIIPQAIADEIAAKGGPEKLLAGE